MSTKNRTDDDDAFGEEDLYGDLKLPAASSGASTSTTTTAPASQTSQSTTGLRPSGLRPSSSHHPKSLTDQVQELQATVERLQAENETLKRNMGTLFRTATAELARKDRQLLEARQQLEQQ